jgi:subtilisin family serine protease
LIKLASRFMAALVLVALPLAAAEKGKDVYIVRLQEASLVQTAGPGKLALDAPDNRRALDRLQAVQDEALAAFDRALGHAVEPLARYAIAFDGLALELTSQEALALSGMPGVVSVQRSARFRIASDAGPAWIGATGIWNGTTTGGLPGTQGEGMVIGVIDTGIALGHASFADIGGDGYNHTNPRGAGNYVGWCNPANPNYSASLACNDKLIGVWSWADSGGNPRDDEGHGTHTASTAAGNHVNASLAGGITRAISGVAPHANLIAYDACDSDGYCYSWVVLAAVDQAVADGVDVINLSLADSSSSSPWYDSVAVALLNARSAGVFTAAAAADDYYGSPARAPWVLGVTASSHNRHFASSLANLSGGFNPPADLAGTGLSAAYGPAGIVRAGLVGSYDCSSPFPPGTFGGRIVVCSVYPYDDLVVKGQNVLAGGAGGAVFAQSYTYGVDADPTANVLPSVVLPPNAANALYNWLSSGSSHAGRISGTTVQISPSFADRLWLGDSSGPGDYASDLVKPDVAAPGQEILAAHTDAGGFRVLSGTSMATAHAAGAAALLMALHPSWTPAEIQSAFVTTGAGVTRQDDTAASPHDAGGGRLDLSAAARAGLVLHETTPNFQAANPSNNGHPETLNLAGLANDACILSCGWTRTVRSTRASPTQWSVTVEAPPGAGLTVSPMVFNLAGGATQTLQITATGPTSLSDWKYGRVTLTETGGQAPPAHFPIATFWVYHNTLTVQKSGQGTGRVTSAPAGIDCGGDCSEPFPEDSSVTLTATADPGSVFVGWGGYCDDVDTTCQLYMYSPQTAVAYFNPPIPDKALANQIPLRDAMNAPVSGGTWAYYSVDVGSGTGELVVDLLDLDGDATLYVRNGAKPSWSQYNCSDYSYYGTPNRRCVITLPAAGRWWVGVNNYDEGVTIRYSVRASWGTTADRQLASGSPVDDYVSSQAPGAAWKYYFVDLPTGSSNLAVELSQLSADGDLYVRQGAKPDRSNFDCASTHGATATELCSFGSPQAGRWWIGVNNFSAGTVTYTLKADWQTVDLATDFYTVTPCRIFDSRSGQALSPGIVQPVQVTGACQIPAAAKAVSVNITVVGPNGGGYIVFYPGDEVPPLSSAINYRAGQTRANNAILKLGAAGNLAALSIQEGWAVDVIVDVNGYFQ